MEKKKPKKTYCFDSYEMRLKRLQEFFNARDSSLKGLYRKFGVLPSNRGRKFRLKEGYFNFSKEDINLMLNTFKSVSSETHGWW